MSQNPNNFATRLGQRAYRLQRMENYLSLALAATGDEREQRKYMQLLSSEAYAINEPVVDWLVQIISHPAPVVELPVIAETFVCDTCNRSFKTKHALCGHQRTHGSKP